MSDSQDSTPFVAPALEELAELFPGYEFQHLIACGGMGAVYAAVQRSLDREVAFKILPREFGADAAFRIGFETEAKAMARLNHPNLIGVYDFGEVNGMLYLVMEYVAGQSLFHSAHGNAIDAGEVVRLVSGICQGLSHAHKHGIIHRDIKPANILLDLHAEPKIGDFGLARPVEKKDTEGEEIFGTPHYTAPEVVHNPLQVDHRADIFSLGVMLHELLTGRLPADDPRPPSAIIHCDPRFDNVVHRATDPNPENRYATADEIMADLQKISTTPGPRILQTAAHGGQRTTRSLPGARRTTRRGPIKVKQPKSKAPVILVLIVLVGAMAVLFNNKRKATEEPGEPRESVTVKTTSQPEKEETPAEEVAVETTRPAPEDTAPPAADPVPGDAGDTSMESETAGTSAGPVFDVEAFLLKAKRIMADKAAPVAAARDQAMENAFKGYHTAVDREVRSITVASQRELVRSRIEDVFSDWQEDGGRIPEDVPEEFAQIRGAEVLQTEYLARQTRAAITFRDGIAKLDSDYQRGIQMQIERLDAAKDPAAVALLQEEITRAKEDANHFLSLVLPEDPALDDVE